MAFWSRDPFLDDPFFSRSPLDFFFGLPTGGMGATTRRITGAEGQEQEGQVGEQEGQVAARPQQQWLTTPLSGFRVPRIDIEETDKNWIVKADLPGTNKEDVKIHLKDDAFVIEGERRDDRDEKDSNRHVIERSFGKFRRMIQLPAEVDRENVVATTENGVLKVTFGKKPATQPRAISIS
ncbi:hypothetical protein SeMB42_g04912 [Synchytrium endobioticum]|uniref:SHSP domain-containing protein n=1 Tax=Synchytrium endobioticum TaxID=286115 RepID=A0A507CGC1_9FUNG|nr:hypothetical protein SeLEV6574_g07768 [Synchytrium endobioticum]TPX42974.1 hypothetical protein SeMB42_g04912 [Synchytrium endobioticum]